LPLPAVSSLWADKVRGTVKGVVSDPTGKPVTGGTRICSAAVVTEESNCINEVGMPIEEYFAKTYSEARRKFVEASRQSKSKLQSYVLAEHGGPDGEELAMDVARVGPERPRNLLVVVSATHGIEGFCGSGCQVGYFSDQLFEALPTNAGALLIHALNPYGFAWLRRVNESNVDLNRNFRDFASPLPASPEYDALHKILVPDDWQGPKRDEADRALQSYFAEKGLRGAQAAIQGGQFTHPDGLFYGGNEASWSNRTLHKILRDHVSSDITNVAVLDLHTGLGPSGYGEPIHLGTSQSFERAKAWFGDGVKNPAMGNSISAMVTGSLAQAITDALPNSQVMYLALEYGTIAAQDVLTALRADNWLHAVAKGQSALACSIKQEMRAAFYVDTPYWKAAVYGRFADFVLRASRGLADV
jgi:hypothetical protein